MSNKMLIDASHPEETRVVVLRGNRVEEFDFEAADRQQLRGNIYLAKVTRVEPSLQAAFVDYGGNRHGFLAFSEIHPDYYQIPYADRQALLQEHAREEEEQDAADQAADEAAEREAGAAAAIASPDDHVAGEAQADSSNEPQDAAATEAGAADDLSRSGGDPDGAASSEGDQHSSAGAEDVGVEHEPEQVESVGAEDALEEVPVRRKPRPRQYKIQEVIKRRQVLLVQVVKEERGNKGAALTTYLSLAGRYSVLMPNTGRGGGISRKITNPADRKRLKDIASELDVPEGMGVILRTAGANRTKSEVKRDFEYLLRLWENVRELTLQSTAPKLVYEEGSLIKRSIRDLYSREIEQIVVAGDDAYREAKDFMRMLMPSHAKNVQQYRDDAPIFARSGVEAQLDAMFSPQVTLRSGGYIVINQTEALVSIDVNSGRSTREHSIEDTALNTNLEAAEEIARQLRLRDLAGLIVIDFIDMEENRNNRAVERKMKDCLKADRARIQVGRISHFGLMEMSRQRIRAGVLESSIVPCPHCRGIGQVRSISSLSLQILRSLEDHLLRHSGHHILVRTRPEVALYVLNQKRRHLAQLEARFGLAIAVSAEAPDDGAGFTVERGAAVEDRPERELPVVRSEPAQAVDAVEPMEVEEPDEFGDEAETDTENAGAREESASGGREPRRRRRGRRSGSDSRSEGSRGEQRSEIRAEERADVEPDEAGERADADDASTRAGSTDDRGQESRKRRRGRRGGRRRSRNGESGDPVSAHDAAPSDPAEDEPFEPADTSDTEAAWLDGASVEAGAQFAEPAEPAEPVERSEPANPAADLPQVAAAQVSGIFGVETGSGNGYDHGAEESVSSPQPNGGDTPNAVGDRQRGFAADALPFAAPQSVPAADGAGAALETAAEAEPDMAAVDGGDLEVAGSGMAAFEEVLDESRPKRSGWWSRRTTP